MKERTIKCMMEKILDYNTKKDCLIMYQERKQRRKLPIISTQRLLKLNKIQNWSYFTRNLLKNRYCIEYTVINSHCEIICNGILFCGLLKTMNSFKKKIVEKEDILFIEELKTISEIEGNDNNDELRKFSSNYDSTPIDDWIPVCWKLFKQPLDDRFIKQDISYLFVYKPNLESHLSRMQTFADYFSLLSKK